MELEKKNSKEQLLGGGVTGKERDFLGTYLPVTKTRKRI